jgi:glycosyltransferase involved in cell wall biosynthesis
MMMARNDADLSAMQAREFVRQNYSWERISPQLGQLLSGAHAAHRSANSARQKPKIWILGTWNITCGIAQHACYLAEALKQAGADVLIVGNHMQGHAATGFHEEMFYPVARAWTWDNRFWRNSGIDIETIEFLLARDRPDCVLIQHHTGFMPTPSYEALIYRLHRADVQVGIEFHDARNLPAETLERLAIAADMLLVHASEEYARIPQVFSGKVRQLPLPARIRIPPGGAPVPRDQGPVIGGFGFLRPYKGVLTAIRVVAQLRREYPDIRYHGWHALYDGGESQAHLAECLQEARRLGIEDHIRIDTGFHPLERVIAELHACNVVLLPYASSSEEGASAAVNCALAAQRATIVSAAKIFQPVADAVRIVRSDAIADYREAVSEVLSNAALRMDLEASARDWVEHNSYSNAARTLLDLLVTE